MVLLAALVIASPVPENNTRTWEDAYTLAQQAISKLSLKDKAVLTTGVGWGGGPCVGNINPVDGIQGFHGLCLQDSPTGVRFASGVSAFPASLNLAATFDRRLMQTHGELMGSEFRGKGVNIALGPMMNILRSPTGGRNWEGQGADPYLAAQSARLQVRGMQSQGVIATAKHYIGNEQEINRGSSTSQIEDRAFHEIYLPPFKACVEEGVGAIMCSYNQLNGTYACENDYALNRVLKGDLGFKGIVMTDWWATKATVQSAKGGSDMMMPGDGFYANENPWGQNLVNSVINGQVPQNRVDEMAIRVLATWYKMRQDQGYPIVNLNSFNSEKDLKVNVQGDHFKHIRQVGAASSILLKNSANVLPLGKNLKIAVLGSDAGPGDSTNNKCSDHGCTSGTIAQGWGSGTTNFPYIVTPLDGVSSRAKANGCTVTSMLNDYDLNSAFQTAKSADVAIVFVAANSGEEYITVDGNKGDRNYLKLFRNGDNLINKAAEANQKVVVVIHGPGAVDMTWINNPNVAAVIHALFPGQESGNSIADILFGDVNPSGRLPFTINTDRSKYSADVEYNGKTIVYNEGLLVDYRFHDAKNTTPLFPFGFGLSYTSFVYSDFVASSLQVGENEKRLSVSFNVSNTGAFDGNEVVQLYVGFPAASQSPPKQLKDFDRKLITKGSSQSFTLSVLHKDLRIWNVSQQSWELVNGQYTFFVGSSSRDIKWEHSFEV